jgi:hypothetical protein
MTDQTIAAPPAAPRNSLPTRLEGFVDTPLDAGDSERPAQLHGRGLAGAASDDQDLTVTESMNNLHAESKYDFRFSSVDTPDISSNARTRGPSAIRAMKLRETF